jgi:hypothetical protein
MNEKYKGCPFPIPEIPPPINQWVFTTVNVDVLMARIFTLGRSNCPEEMQILTNMGYTQEDFQNWDEDHPPMDPIWTALGIDKGRDLY